MEPFSLKRSEGGMLVGPPWTRGEGGYRVSFVPRVDRVKRNWSAWTLSTET